MGLDMYLRGTKHFRYESEPKTVDGYRITEQQVELGYWRKHPNLHGFIVNTFNCGEDDCNPITLTVDGIKLIIQAITEGKLPDTQGFFFGKSYGDEKEEDLRIFNAALAWVQEEDAEAHRFVSYLASW